MKIQLLAAVLLAGVVFTSCKKDDPEQGSPVPVVPVQYNGLGDRPGNPTGTQFTLPSNLTIVGNITGGLTYKSSIKPEKKYGQKYFFSNRGVMADYMSYGTGTYVDLYMKIVSNTGHDTTWIIPGGTIFCDSSGTYQNGLIIQDDSILVSGTDTSFVWLKAYCTNLSRHGSDEYAVYRLGVISDNSAIMEVVSILRNKLKPFGNESAIQNIIWNITEYSAALSAEDRATLQQLP